MEDVTGATTRPAEEVDGSGANETSAASSITVNIKTLNGADFELPADTTELVSDLKTKIRQRTNVDETRQRLIYRGKVLADAEPLSTYKVADGHFVHMVARPEGVPPPAPAHDAARSASPSNAAPAATAAAGGAHRADTFGGGLSRVISDRLLMGMGGPAAAAANAPSGAAGSTQARHGHNNNGVDNALLNAAAGLEQGDFLSNMLALGGDGGGGGRGRGARAPLRAPRNPPAADGLVGGRRGARGQQGGGRTAATAGSPLLGRGGDAEQQGGGDGGANLEHVRQGLLTLHTLLSGTASRTRAESPEENAPVSPLEPPSTAAAGGDEVAARDGTNAGLGEDDLGLATATVTAPAASTAPAPASVPVATVEEEGTPTTETPPPAPTTERGSKEVPAGSVMHTAAESRPDAEQDETSVEAAAGALPSYSPVGGGGGGADGGSDGSSVQRAWLAPASFDDESEEEDGAEGADEGGSDSEEENGDEVRGTTGYASPRQGRHRLRMSSESGSPVASRAGSGSGDEEAAESGPEAEAALAAGSEAGSELSEDPPGLQTESGESGDGGDDEDHDGWEDNLHVSGGGWSRGFLRGPLGSSLRQDDEEEDEVGEEGQEECKDEGRRRRQQQQQLRRRFFVGQWLDVKDTVNNWLEATVIDMSSSGSRLQIHYNGWPPRWDEWLSWDSPRIAPFRTRTQHLSQAQHVSPAPVSAVRNAPRTGPLVDDVRVLLPEVQRVLREISPMVEELSACYARQLEEDPSTSPVGGRAVSHTLPWTRQRLQQHRHHQHDHPHTTADQQHGYQSGAGGSNGDASPAQSAAGDWSGRPKAAELAADIAPLFDRLGRVLTDVAPHLARLSVTGDDNSGADAEGEDAAEPGELSWEALARPQQRGGGGGRGSSRSFSRGDSRRGALVGSGRESFASQQQQQQQQQHDETASAFRQLVSTSSPAPAPASSNINIHIHAIVPMRGPPSPPPPPPPTASASAVATPTRAERPPLAVNSSSAGSGGGGRNTSGNTNNNDSRPWNDTFGPTASLLAAAAAAGAGRPPSSGGESGSAAERGGGGGGGGGGGLTSSRNASLSSSFPSDLARQASPLTIATPESVPRPGRSRSTSRSSGQEVARPGPSSSPRGENATPDPSSTDPAGGPGSVAAAASASGSGGTHAHGQHRRSGGWRGLLRAFGVGGNGGSSRVSGRRDGGGSGGGGGGGTEGSGD